tara:strand:+ start:4717 stop:4959 length:243 start_codon:yes stop_codon:yes gene_type:complete
MNKTTQTKINNIILDLAILDLVTEIKPNQDLCKDIGMDSLDKVELIMEVESQFDIQIPDDAIEQINTVNHLYDTVEKILK